jgi:hypothetical protein
LDERKVELEELEHKKRGVEAELKAKKREQAGKPFISHLRGEKFLCSSPSKS